MNTYEEFINNILDTRGRFACGDEYHERHHIVPRCMGGSNDEDNLIDLFAREHFIAHKLLAQENPDNSKLAYAWSMMAWTKRNYQDRCEVSPEEYEEAKKKLSETLSKTRKGIPRPPFSEEHKRKIGEANKGKIVSEETKKKMRESHKNTSEETRKKMRENHADFRGEKHPMFGKHHTKETKEKISLAKKGSPSPTKGKHLSEETKRKLSDAMKGKYVGEKNPNYGNHQLKGKYKREEHPNYGKGKAVIQLTLDNQFVAEYVSAYEAGEITGINRGGITQVCTHVNNRTIAGGFHWMFKDEYLNMKQ